MSPSMCLEAQVRYNLMYTVIVQLTLQCREDRVFICRYTRHGVGLQHFARLYSFLRAWFRALVCESEWWFSDERENDFCLVTYSWH